MKTYIIGIRGFPNVQGGAEKHSEELYRRLAKTHCDITVFTRKPYIHQAPSPREWRNVKFIPLWAPKNTGVETVVHTFLGALRCMVQRPALVHIHNMGPGLFIPLLKLAGLKVVMTYHSINYQHKKWGRFARSILRLGEFLSLHFADRVIVVSRTTQRLLERKYRRRDLHLIPNGVNLPTILPPGKTLEKFGLIPRKYVFIASRMAPEKGLHDLIEAYRRIDKPDFMLVIAGDADVESAYSQELKEKARKIPGIILTGFISGEPLAELYSNAGLFVLPSYHEGMPIALLEALSYDLPVLVSDIPQNREVGLPKFRYFPVGDVDMLSAKILECLRVGISDAERSRQKQVLRNKYNWDHIAEETLSIYEGVAKKMVWWPRRTLRPAASHALNLEPAVYGEYREPIGHSMPENVPANR